MCVRACVRAIRKRRLFQRPRASILCPCVSDVPVLNRAPCTPIPSQYSPYTFSSTGLCPDEGAYLAEAQQQLVCAEEACLLGLEGGA